MILVFTKFWLSISPSRVKRRSRADLQKSEAEEWKTKKNEKRGPPSGRDTPSFISIQFCIPN